MLRAVCRIVELVNWVACQGAQVGLSGQVRPNFLTNGSFNKSQSVRLSECYTWLVTTSRPLARASGSISLLSTRGN